MKNLIEEIEKIIVSLKRQYQNCFEEIDYPLSQVDKLEGRILAYTDVVMALNQHNIITAPKEIKLSEMLDKICELYEEIIEQEIYFNREINCIGYGEYDEDWMKNSWHTFVAFNKDLTIKKINIRPQDNNIKWLYTLWIAGTEIIDDMEE
jgi:hypothetical protein